MKTEFEKHKIAYLTLIVGLLLLTLAFFAAWPDKVLQRIISFLLAAFYLLWGLMTHFKANRLTRGIFFEYLSISLLAVIILTLITY